MNARTIVAAAAVFAAGSSALAQVKISQVYGGGGNTGAPYNRDFVELVNTGGAPVNITGWSIQYASATGTTWTNRALPAVSIPAGGYYLIQMTLTGTNGAALPTPDFTVATSVAMSATDGKVALMRAATTLTGACVIGNANLEDFVGFGGANCFEGAGPTPEPSNTTAVLRALDGCFDTDQNNGNFSVGAPAPRNSASAALVCSGTHTDLAVSMTGGVCPATVGGSVAYTTTVNNYGSNASNATVEFTVPSNLTFVSSVPSGSLAGNVLTVNLGSVGAGGSAVLSVDLTASSQGGGAPLASVASSVNDPGLANNSVIGPSTNVTGNTTTARAIFSSDPTLANSDVPAGLSAPAKFFFTTAQSETFGRLFPSADGSRIIFRAQNSLATTVDTMLVSFPTVNPAAAVTHVQEGVTDIGGGEILGVMDQYPSINAAGDIAFSADTNAASNDEVVLKLSGSTFTTIIREGGLNAVGGAVGTTATAFGITNSGDVLHWHQGPTVANLDDQHVLLGGVIAAREGFNIPTNQVGGATATWASFDNGTDLGKYQDVSGDGAHTLISGDLENGTTDLDAVAIDNAVVLMDGGTIDGVPGTITDIRFADLYGGANWFAYGSNGTEDWLVQNGDLLAKTGDPITQGNSETWDDAVYSQTFFVVAANSNGTYAVGGVTSATDQLNNAAIVLNGRIVLVRENDPVDLNGNGTFDDDAYIRTFRDDRFVLLNDALYFAAELRGGAAYCSGNAKLCDALIRIPVPCPADLDNDGNVANGGNYDFGVDINDLLYFLTAFEAGNVDLDNDGDPSIGIPDGGTDINDLLFFLARFEAGC